MTNEQLVLTTDPLVLHGQARVAGTRVTVGVVLDCLAAGMSESEILAEYPLADVAGNSGGRCLWGRPGRRGTHPAQASGVKDKLDEDAPASLGDVLIGHDHDGNVVPELLVHHRLDVLAGTVTDFHRGRLRIRLP